MKQLKISLIFLKDFPIRRGFAGALAGEKVFGMD
jgi:hypothetical protein